MLIFYLEYDEVNLKCIKLRKYEVNLIFKQDWVEHGFMKPFFYGQ